METSHPRIVVAGIAGSGKTTVGSGLASRLGIRYIDGDSLHPPDNIGKMSAGSALTDADRWPWLAAVATELHSGSGCVVSCSALRRSYRDKLREPGRARFIFLTITQEVAVERATHRHDHFMPPDLVESQLETLEMPQPDEIDVTVIYADVAVDSVIEAAFAALSTEGNTASTS
jgi:carbohydrate kinase (thermoresistant glucokinase family)